VYPNDLKFMKPLLSNLEKGVRERAHLCRAGLPLEKGRIPQVEDTPKPTY